MANSDEQAVKILLPLLFKFDASGRVSPDDLVEGQGPFARFNIGKRAMLDIVSEVWGDEFIHQPYDKKKKLLKVGERYRLAEFRDLVPADSGEFSSTLMLTRD